MTFPIGVLLFAASSSRFSVLSVVGCSRITHDEARSSKAHNKGVIAPTSRACVEIAIKWFKIRVISLNNTRMY